MSAGSRRLHASNRERKAWIHFCFMTTFGQVCAPAPWRRCCSCCSTFLWGRPCSWLRLGPTFAPVHLGAIRRALNQIFGLALVGVAV